MIEEIILAWLPQVVVGDSQWKVDEAGILCDWLKERGLEDWAEGLHWVVTRKKFPKEFATSNLYFWHNGAVNEFEKCMSRSHIPQSVLDKLGRHKYWEWSSIDFDGWPKAVLALMKAWRE